MLQGNYNVTIASKFKEKIESFLMKSDRADGSSDAATMDNGHPTAPDELPLIKALAAL